jgi:hypothetical protein
MVNEENCVAGAVYELPVRSGFDGGSTSDPTVFDQAAADPIGAAAGRSGGCEDGRGGCASG